jgi:hypothetical protein
MDPRHDILNDEPFWLNVEFYLCGFFASASDRSRRGWWCDGVIPESARNTREGVEVTGRAWIMNSSTDGQWKFTLSVPQSMLRHRPSESTRIEVTLDEPQKRLLLSLFRKASED